MREIIRILLTFLPDSFLSSLDLVLPDTLNTTSPQCLVLWCEDLPCHGVWYRAHPSTIGHGAHLQGDNQQHLHHHTLLWCYQVRDVQ